jgi:hypothetical protein
MLGDRILKRGHRGAKNPARESPKSRRHTDPELGQKIPQGLKGACHSTAMANKLRKIYRIVPQRYSGYAVEISVDNFAPTLVTPFATEAEAQTWIVDQQAAEVRSLED